MSSKYGELHLAFKDGYGFWRHFTYPSKKAVQYIELDAVTDRQILPDEIVIETDMPFKQDNEDIALKVSEKLKLHHINHEGWYSGNKSTHIHIIMPQLNSFHSDADKRLLKELFTKWVFNYDEQLMSDYRVDMGLSGKHLIKIEHGWHPDTGYFKKKVLQYSDPIANVFPRSVMEKFNKFKAMKAARPKHIISVSGKMHPAVRSILANDLKDYRKRTAFICYNKLLCDGVVDADKYLQKWNDSLSKPLPDRILLSALNTPEGGKCYTITDYAIWKYKLEVERNGAGKTERQQL